MLRCADSPTGLNAVLDGDCNPLPFPEDIFTIPNFSTSFANLDLAEAYLQKEVTPESRKLQTITNHIGLYQFTWLPFGVRPSPAIFQCVMDTTPSGLPGVSAYLDDIIVTGKPVDTLYGHLETVL